MEKPKIGIGVIALGLYGVVAIFQSDDNFGRTLAAYGGVFVARPITWGMIADGYRPDLFDVIGASVHLARMVVIMYAPRSHSPSSWPWCGCLAREGARVYTDGTIRRRRPGVGAGRLCGALTVGAALRLRVPLPRSGRTSRRPWKRHPARGAR